MGKGARIALLSAGVVFLICGSIWGEGENMALGNLYKLYPRPNYRYCTDPGDTKQLTDGNYTEGYFWTQLSTVGWQWARPAIITVDLGKVEPISGASYNTAAGTADVTWPMAIEVLVSDNGKEFYQVGDLVQLSSTTAPPDKGYRVHRYLTRALRTHGRFVTFMIFPSGPYIFVDEVEVYRGKADWVNLPHEGEAITDVVEYFRSSVTRIGVESRLRKDIAELRKLIQGSTIAQDAKRRLLSVVRNFACRRSSTRASVPFCRSMSFTSGFFECRRVCGGRSD